MLLSVPGAGILGILGIVFDRRKWLAITITSIVGVLCLFLFVLPVVVTLLCR